MSAYVLLIVVFTTAVSALTITSPSAGQTLDPTQPITVSWTSEASDPSDFDLVVDGNGGLFSNTKVATGITTSSGTYYLPANAIITYGSGFVLKAQTPDGDDLAFSGSFDLSLGSATTTNGQVSFISTNTFTGTITSGIASAAQTAMVASTTSSDTVSSISSDSSASSANTGPGTTSSDTRSGFSTSTISRSSTTSASATSSASVTTSANAQPRLVSNSQIVLSAAGVLAGLAALLA